MGYLKLNGMPDNDTVDSFLATIKNIIKPETAWIYGTQYAASRRAMAINAEW